MRPQRTRRPLTTRHVDVLRLAAQGMTNRQIGQSLYLSEDTVKTHLRRAYQVLGVATRAEAVLELHRRGLLDKPPPPEPIYPGPERRSGLRPGRRAGDVRRTHPRPSRP